MESETDVVKGDVVTKAQGYVAKLDCGYLSIHRESDRATPMPPAQIVFPTVFAVCGASAAEISKNLRNTSQLRRAILAQNVVILVVQAVH